MDYLKTRAPFWKRETGPSGAHWVEAEARDETSVTRWGKKPAAE
jgi:molybdopterin synthase catalytic subunit